ncbi:MAG TPA: lysozyme inhibitor LprI family protein, partial [Dongiaceae bacterium]|nr:lysozyme inhibitor LprI family protein [Dongiaceae bacterium]
MAWRGSWGWLAAIALLLSAWGHAPASAAGPSFDCTVAKAPIERLICSDSGLSQADADMTQAYKALRQTLDAKGRADLLQVQRRWLQSRFTECKIPVSGEIPASSAAGLATCLNGLYAARIKALGEAQAADKNAANNSSTNNNAAPAASASGTGATAQAAAGQTGAGQAETKAQPTTAQPAAGGSAAGGAGNASAPGTGEAAAARLDQTVFTATGRQETLLTVPRFGRYALTTHSGQGTAVQLIDRMAGPGDLYGVPGSSDGRIDTFLDHGVYKVVLLASDKGSGEAELDVHPFAELNSPAIPRLTELKLVQGDLDDFQQRSYWLDITERRTVAIEAAGRNLADLRLWRDGNWLVDATPEAVDSEPEPGKPLNVRRLVTVLEPGLYLLSAYGGPTLPWAKTSDAHPFYLRMGIPSIGEGGRQVHIASPFGVDRYLVPASANYFRLELPEAEAAGLSVAAYSESNPFAEGDREVITKKSVPPVAEVEDDSKSTGLKLITINRDAGKPYLLQHFKSVERYYFKESGDYWLSTLHSGYGDDSIDATPVLTEQLPNQPEAVYQAQAPELNAQARWTRRFNLLDTATAYFHVTEAGTYVIETASAPPNQGNAAPANAAPANATPANGGAIADYRFEPMIEFGANYQAPDFQPAGQGWQLEPGYYVLTMRPKDNGKGILTVTVRGATAQPGGPDDASQAKVTSATWPSISLDDGASYTLYLNRQPGVEAGVVLRTLPIDLGQDLPVNLPRGQNLDVPVRATVGDTVTAIGEDGQPATFAVDHGSAVTAWTATDGNHVVTLANKGDKPAFVTLHDTPAALAPETPLPPVEAERLAAIPVFPALSAEAPAYFDIAKDEKKTFALSIKQPGLYRLQSSGLLQTEGAIRTRIILALDRQSNNGTGRNFLIQQYLGEGDYQLTLNAQGQTRGHMGVGLTPTVLDDGGQLSLDLPARHSLQAGHGLRYSFTIPADGHYHLRALGLSRTFTMRLE